MKIKILSVCLALCAVTVARAVLVDFTLSYDQLELKNGKVLKKLTLLSYDTLSGNVSAKSGTTLLSLRLIDLPEAVVTKIQERVPKQTETEIAAERKQAEEDKAEAKRRALELEQRQLAEAKENRDARRNQDVKQADQTAGKQAATEADVSTAAEAMASHYFAYEADPNSSIGYVFGSDIVLEDPEPVPGWNSRWRVKGRVGIRYLTNTGGSAGRTTRDFEVLLEMPLRKKPKLIDISVK